MSHSHSYFFVTVGMTHEDIRQHKPDELMRKLSDGDVDTEYLKSILAPDYTVEDIVHGVMAMMGGNDYSGDYMYSESTPGEMATTVADQSASNPTTESSKPEKGVDDIFKIEFHNSKKTNKTTTEMPDVLEDDELTAESNGMATDHISSDVSMTNETVRNATTKSVTADSNDNHYSGLIQSVKKRMKDGNYSTMIQSMFG